MFSYLPQSPFSLPLNPLFPYNQKYFPLVLVTGQYSYLPFTEEGTKIQGPYRKSVAQPRLQVFRDLVQHFDHKVKHFLLCSLLIFSFHRE